MKISRVLIRTFLFSIFAAICFVQCFAIIKSYLQYPISVDMYDVSPNLISSLQPGITICNNNR